MIPSVPVILKFKRVANFRAFKSSSNNKTSSYSVAKAIALASPESTWVSRKFWYFLSETDWILIQVGNSSPNSSAISGVVINSRYTFFSTVRIHQSCEK